MPNKLFYISILLSFCLNNSFGQYKKEHQQLLMGTQFQIVCIAPNEVLAQKAVDTAVQIIQNIENKISSWKKTSETTNINQMAGIRPVKVSDELFYLINRSLKFSKLSKGAFDISIKPLFSIWDFKSKKPNLPAKILVDSMLQYVDYKNIILNEESKTVFLAKKGMQIDFGGIGKGYAADKVKIILQKMGIENALINASGDLCAWGKDLNQKDWQVAIANPEKGKNAVAWLSIRNQAIATSGNYEKFFMHQGKRYAHILNTHTGYPTTGIKSVSVVSPTAELADAFATTIFVLGKNKGLQLINEIPQVECIIIDDENKTHYSKNIKLNIE